jgi:hypothetical protein
MSRLISRSHEAFIRRYASPGKQKTPALGARGLGERVYGAFALHKKEAVQRGHVRNATHRPN